MNWIKSILILQKKEYLYVNETLVLFSECEVIKIQKDELQQSIINEFWTMIIANQEACIVQWNEDDKDLMLYIELSHEGMLLLNMIAERLDVEDSIVMSLYTNDIMIDALNFIEGYGITIEELWEARPENLKEEW